MLPPYPPPTRRFWLYDKFKQVYTKQVDGGGLAIFRIVFCAVLLAEVAHLFYFRHLIFDVIPFVEGAEIGFTTPLLLWMATLVLLGLGLYTRPAALVNYGFALILFSSLKTYAYMMTPVYIGMSFLFLFLPISRRLSLDRLRLKLRYSGPRFRYEPPTTVSQLAYYAPVLVGIGFVYFDSALYKLTSPLWLTGLGMWKPLSLPYETPFNYSYLLNQEVLVKFLGYLTLVFELVFLFLYPFRRYRPWLLLIGLGLHLGVLVSLPIPLFAVGFSSLYVLVVPAGWWRRWLAPRVSRPSLAFYYDAESRLSTRVCLLLEQLDRHHAVQFRSAQDFAGQEPALQGLAPQALHAAAYSVDAKGQAYNELASYEQVLRRIGYLRPLAWLLRLPGGRALGGAAGRWIARSVAAGSGPTPAVPVGLLPGATRRTLKLAGAAAGLAGLTLLQGLVSYDTPLVRLLRRNSRLEYTLVGRGLARISEAVEGPAHNFLGIAKHPIALDEHFASYTHLIAVTYTGPDGIERFLPITQPSGQPGAYLSGAVWLKWTYSVVSAKVDQERLAKGIRSFTAFWAHQNGVDLANCRFSVKVKKIAEPLTWQRDFLNQQLRKPWQNAGFVTWHNQQFAAHLATIEAL
ncbi:DUF393 domain-containing protein [Hymenobacter sp. UV11]|uniref:DCC1-like thiol-disulfide oxidoreductase family protein n=1 Tax=Hymenobacter sp. UV11 TaxID=1849735 RepID=UPI00105BB5DC|nr:DCC1-like thiol-disulfide oxidoreductase family protein [Hymenobacter sp. UV11]TDN37713.1 hypothetical protein A8B98_04125 [Hymenobacter sp. UV11]TFZ68915.1 DUF393 domain-containing protein [Hymenobacter sp. UV11]